MKILQISTTVVAVVLAVIHAVYPNIKIDHITLVLLGFAIFPWLIPFIKSFESPGGYKIEFKEEFEKVTHDVTASGLASKSKMKETHHSFQSIIDQDPNLALAGLRIEIENKLNEIVEKNIQPDFAPPTRYRTAYHLIDFLLKEGILSVNESTALRDLISLLNKAVHGMDVEKVDAYNAMNLGLNILSSLENKL